MREATYAGIKPDFFVFVKPEHAGLTPLKLIAKVRHSHACLLRGPYALEDTLRQRMPFNKAQQISEALKRSASPVVCVAEGAGADGYAAALGLARALGKLGKKVEIVAADGKTPSVLSFLAGADTVKTTFERLRRFRIELDISKTPVDGLSYELKNQKLLIHLEPRQGSWKKEDVKMAASMYRHDLIIVLGAADFEACGKLYSAHPDFFTHTPVLNIDVRAENEHFGHLNAVDLTASSLGEACLAIVESMDPSLVDEEMATAFLTGIIARTRSFRARTVTPKHLEVAGKLLGKGAKRDKIVENLYRTRTVPTLKLWGTALTRLKSDVATKLVWCVLTRADFTAAGTDERELADVVDELITSSPDAQVIALFYEAADGSIQTLVRAERPRNAVSLTENWHGIGTPEEARVSFKGKTIIDVEREVIAQMKKTLTA